MVTSSELEGKVCPGVRGGLRAQEAEDKVTVTGALKPTVVLKYHHR